MNGREIALAPRADVRIFTRRAESVQSQQCERKCLPGPVVQVGADAAQRLFVQGGGASGSLPHAFVQAQVLIEPPLQLGLLASDRIAAALDDARQQDVREQAYRGDNSP